MCSQPVWGTIECAWRAIPDEEQRLAMTMMLELCRHLFLSRGHTLDSPKIRTAIEARLYQARRTWIRGRKTSHKRQVQTRAVNGADDETVATAISQSMNRRIMDISSILDQSK